MKSILKFIFSSLFAFTCYQPVFSQEIHLSHDYADSVKCGDWNTGHQLKLVAVYNDAVKAVGYPDTIIVKYASGTYQYQQEGNPVLFYPPGTFTHREAVTIWGTAHRAEDTFIQTSTKQSDSTHFELLIRYEEDVVDVVIRLENYLHDVLYGISEKITCGGALLEHGYYQHKDTLYVDTLIQFDPETYEEVIILIPRTKAPVKCGTWLYYTPRGVLLREEQYAPCPVKRVY